MNFNLEGLLYGPNLQHLDHIAPICAILGIPLNVTEQDISILAQTYYPDLVVHTKPYNKIAHELYNHCDAIISCLPTDILNEIFFLPSCISQKKLHYVWCPHGNSEKGFDSYFAEILEREKVILCYGPKVLDNLKYHHDLSKHRLIKIGNYRLAYYKKLKVFYDKLIDQKVNRFLKHPKNILYAPSWKEKDTSSHVLEELQAIISQKPEGYNLLVKLHPNTVTKFGVVVNLLGEDHEDVFFINDIPTIYPILNITDIYLGTHSSIVYDFLYYQKPILLIDDKLSFAQTIESRHLNQLKAFINQSLKSVETSTYKAEYEHAFFNDVSLDSIKQNILHINYEK